MSKPIQDVGTSKEAPQPSGSQSTPVDLRSVVKSAINPKVSGTGVVRRALTNRGK